MKSKSFLISEVEETVRKKTGMGIVWAGSWLFPVNRKLNSVSADRPL